MADPERESILAAALRTGIDAKRIRGWVFRGLSDIHFPIGSLVTDDVYGWSLDRFLEERRRRAAQAGLPPELFAMFWP